MHTTNEAGLTCLFWCNKPDPQIEPQQQTDANRRSGASHLWFISYFHLIGGCFGVIRLRHWALCCGWAVYKVLPETCWQWGRLRQRAAPLSRSGQYLIRVCMLCEVQVIRGKEGVKCRLDKGQAGWGSREVEYNVWGCLAQIQWRKNPPLSNFDAIKSSCFVLLGSFCGLVEQCYSSHQ